MEKQVVEQINAVKEKIKLKNKELTDSIEKNNEQILYVILYQFAWIESADLYKFYGINLSKINGLPLGVPLGQDPNFVLNKRFLDEDVKADLLQCNLKESDILLLNEAIRTHLPKDYIDSLSKQKMYSYIRSEFKPY